MSLNYILSMYKSFTYESNKVLSHPLMNSKHMIYRTLLIIKYMYKYFIHRPCI